MSLKLRAMLPPARLTVDLTYAPVSKLVPAKNRGDGATTHVELGEGLDPGGERARGSAGSGDDEGGREGEDLIVVEGTKSENRQLPTLAREKRGTYAS